MHLDVVRIDLVEGFVRTTYIDYNGVQYVTEVPVMETVMKASKMRKGPNGKVEILDDDGNVVGKQG
jgi:hypothetical protein